MAVVRQFGPQLSIKSSIKSIFRQRDILPKNLIPWHNIVKPLTLYYIVQFCTCILI